MHDDVETFGTAVDGLSPFSIAGTSHQVSDAIQGLLPFKIGQLVRPEIKYGSFLLRYDVTEYNSNYLFYGLITTNGDYRIRRVDRNQVTTWAIGAWEDRETLVYE